DGVQPLGLAEAGVDGQDDATVAGQEIVDGHPPVGAGAVEVDQRRAASAREELDPTVSDGERVLAAQRGYGCFGHPTPLFLVSRAGGERCSSPGPPPRIRPPHSFTSSHSLPARCSAPRPLAVSDPPPALPPAPLPD